MAMREGSSLSLEIFLKPPHSLPILGGVTNNLQVKAETLSSANRDKDVAKPKKQGS